MTAEQFTVPAGRVVRGTVRVPGSKSMTQRYFNLALVGRAPLIVQRPLVSEDPRLFLDALRAVGFEVIVDGQAVRLVPGSSPRQGSIFCGNGGTMFRFLTAALTTVPGTWQLDGIARLRERPVTPLVSALRQLGAHIECPREEGHAPLVVHGDGIAGGTTGLDAGASSQYLSALLMASLAARGPVEIVVHHLASAPYVALTLEAIRDFGAEVEVVPRGDGGQIYRVVPVPPRARTVVVEGDFSAAAYPAAAAAVTGGRVRIQGLRRDSRQGDRALLALMDDMGARVRWQDDEATVEGGALTAVDVDLSSMPDQVPTVAALAPFARGTTRIRNVAHLRIKESDRLEAMATELQRAGARCVEHTDGLEIEGVWADTQPPSDPISIHTYGDHRIAMAMAIVGLRRPGLSIREPAVVGKSYPDFWIDLEQLITA